MRGLTWIAVAVVVGLVACAHQDAGPGPVLAPAPRPAPTVSTTAAADEVAAALTSTQAWLARAPRCEAAAVAAAKGVLPAAGQPVQLRGRLAVGEPLCTMMACTPARACCNTCGWTWLVKPREDGRGSVRVQEAGANEPLRGAGADCVIEKLPATDVVVTGRLSGEDLVVDGRLCVVEEAPR
jgi:hypothetical protein